MSDGVKPVPLVDSSGRPLDGQEIFWDKASPLRSPVQAERHIPEWFLPVHRWLRNVIEDESMVLDLCLEKAVEIVEYQHNRGLVGIDHFQDSGGANRTAMVAMAAPISIELYKQVLSSLNGSRNAEFTSLVNDALSHRK